MLAESGATLSHLTQDEAAPQRGSGDGSSIDQIVILNDFAQAQGGATVIALLAAREFRRLGHKVTYLSGDGQADELAQIGVTHVAMNGAQLLDLPRSEAMRQGLHNGKAARVVADWIAANDTPGTVYHLHNWSQILSPSVYEALRPVEDRLVVTCHDFFNICPNGGFVHFGDSRSCEAKPLSAKCLLSQCDRRSSLQKYWRTLRHVRLNTLARFGRSRATFTFLHDRMEQKFVDSGFAAQKRITIPNPVSPWTTERIPAERNEGYLFVGRIGRDKGADIAIAAAKAAGQKITLVGSGEIGMAARHPEPDVQFAGWRNSAEIAELARHARALIVPSRIVEPFGLVLLEAAMSGLPVIVTSHAFLAGDIASVGAGVSFDIDRRERLAELLTDLADDDEAIERMSKRGFERARELCHTPESWAQELAAIMEDKLRATSTGLA